MDRLLHGAWLELQQVAISQQRQLITLQPGSERRCRLCLCALNSATYDRTLH